MANTRGPWTMSLLGDLMGVAANGKPHHITRCERIANPADKRLLVSSPAILELLKRGVRSQGFNHLPDLKREMIDLINKIEGSDQWLKERGKRA